MPIDQHSYCMLHDVTCCMMAGFDLLNFTSWINDVNIGMVATGATGKEGCRTKAEVAQA
jgi:hypothetical protein